ncbi:DUF2922 domain-containing protein [Cytobacillus sp. IB215665]|uniref:DUF2922 domain-containing protein n=1 Tax=Cytobacillus sp. IB215665 TaxID=3097357 RepID=UPI002A16674C|nr:DUF2922 domain-containing protein [Cytobacillus sp. IB215665]MDX8366386.1 DUF2922 domain-containing protein [Cytobacillus sp. IB215665]
MAKTLELKFENEEGKVGTIFIENPTEPVDTTLVSSVMDTILSSDVFTSSGGGFIRKKGARVVERNVTDIQIL